MTKFSAWNGLNSETINVIFLLPETSKHSTPVMLCSFPPHLKHRDIPWPSGKGSATEKFPQITITPTTSVLSPRGGLQLGNMSAETCLQLWAGMFRNVLECLLLRQEKPRNLGNPQGVGSRVRCSWWQVSQTVTSEFRRQSRESRHGSLSSLSKLVDLMMKVSQ